MHCDRLVIMSIFNIILIIMLFITQNDAAKIRSVFPTPSTSNQVVFRPFIQDLVKRGHEVLSSQ